jgi:hypothetical protein
MRGARWLRWSAKIGLVAACVPIVALWFIALRYHLDLAASLRSALRRQPTFTIDAARLSTADYRPVTRIASLASTALDELSGLAASRRRDDLLWAINDSGDGPFLYAIGTDGSDRGMVTVEGARNIDWEDLAAFELDGEPYLLIADVGDNLAWRPAITLYIVPEPRLADARFAQDARTVPKWVLRARYPDGPHDCEAVAVDAAQKLILLLSKRAVPPVLYALDLAPRHDDPRAFDHLPVARRLTAVGGIPAPTRRDIEQSPKYGPASSRPTAMDISPDSRHAIVLTYKEAYRFDRDAGESWAKVFERIPVRVRVPKMRAMEAIAFARDGRSLYVSSEQRPTPLFRLELQ